MKNKLQQLDVDFIGGQQPLTKEELLAISQFIKANKNKRVPSKLGSKKKLSVY